MGGKSKEVLIVCHLIIFFNVIFKAKINCLKDILELNIPSSLIDIFPKSPKEQDRILIDTNNFCKAMLFLK